MPIPSGKLILNSWSRRVLASMFGLGLLAASVSIARHGASIPAAPETGKPSRLAALAAERYSGDGLSVAPTPSGARLRSAFQKLNGDATRGGLWVTSTSASESGRLRMIASGIGRDERSTRLAGSGTVTVNGGTVTFTRPRLTEQYATSVDGLRQDFIIPAKLDGAGELRVDLALSGARAESVPNGAKLTLDESGRTLVYGRLHVVDANGRVLPATMSVVAADALVIRVDDGDATYPVRIDPTFSDADWVSLNPGVAGTNGTVSAIVTDVTGNLYIGGFFSLVGTVPATNIAMWDGTQWTALGTGAGGGSASVSTLVASGTDIYVGGNFGQAGGVANTSRVAKWNGSAWSALGTGANNTVGVLKMFGGVLYAGGNFTTIGGVAAGGLATWNGSSWSAFGGTGVTGAVNDFAMIGSDLYVACSAATANGVTINRIGKWDGTTWSPLGAGSSNQVLALGVMGGNLYAGSTGAFTLTAGGTSNFFAMWNPTTSTWTSAGAVSSSVYSILPSGGSLYVGGGFATAGGVTASGIAKLTGSTWSAVGVGTEGFLPGKTPIVNALAFVGSDLWAGGTFLSMGGNAAHGLAKWNGSAWSTTNTGLDNEVNAMAFSGADLYIAGDFISAPNGLTVNRVAKWNGTTWSALGTGVNHIVNSMAFDAAGNLYVGGRLGKAGGVTANLIAKWNGSTWSALGSGIAGNGAVTAIAVNSAGDVFAGGNFTGSQAGGVANTNRIAKWNGSAWSALNTGLDDGLVSAITTIGTDVYAGGTFTKAGGLTVNYIAKWNGSGWSALGTGMNAAVNALQAVGANIYVGGGFTTAGGITANRIAKWNGSVWSTFGVGVNSTVNALSVDSGGRVYIGGNFSPAGGASGKFLARWDGAAWAPLGSGVDGMFANPVSALALDTSGHLFVGGSFMTVGDSLVSAYLARADINVNHAPVANAGADQNAAATSINGAAVTLNGSASSDSDGDTLTYSWTNDFNSTVLTGAGPTITVPLGAHTLTLTVTDGGGLTSTDTVVVTVADAFSISITTPPLSGASYLRNQVVLGEFTCSDTANLISSCSANAANLDTATAGTKTFTVTATNSLGDTSSQSRTYIVLPQSAQSIAFPAPGATPYGNAVTLAATATSGLAVSYTSTTPLVCSVSGAVASTLSAGNCSITANQAGDANWLAAPPATQTFAVQTRPVTATLTANSKVYDGTTAEPNAGLSCALSGVLPADQSAVLCAPTGGTFDSASAGSLRTVTATLTLTGAAASNYTFGAAGTTTLAVSATNAATSTTASVVYGQSGSFVTTAVNPASADSLSSPRGVAADANGNIYVADRSNNRILFFPFGQTTATRVYGQGGNFTTNAAGLSATSLNTPNRVTVDSTGLYVSDAVNNRVLYFPGTSTTPTRVYGQNGSFTSSTYNASGINANSLGSTRGIAIDAAGNVYIADGTNNRVLFYPAGSTTATRVYGQNGSFTTGLANNTGGVGGVVSASSLSAPNGLRLDTAGNLYVVDQNNNRVLFFLAGETTATAVYGQGGSFTTNAGGIL